jgi:hypothetical protein
MSGLKRFKNALKSLTDSGLYRARLAAAHFPFNPAGNSVLFRVNVSTLCPAFLNIDIVARVDARDPPPLLG